MSCSASPPIRTYSPGTSLDLVGITERSAQRIISELEEAGYLSHSKVGRRNHYEVRPDRPLRHPLEGHLAVEAILEVLTPVLDPTRTQRD